MSSIPIQIVKMIVRPWTFTRWHDC